MRRRILLRRTAIRPGRLAARLRVNVLLVISGLATSSTLSLSSVPPPPFLDLLPENRLLPFPFRARPFSIIRITRSTSRHRPCKLESSRGSVLAANSRVLDEIDRIRDGDHPLGISRSSDLKIKASSRDLQADNIDFERDQSRETKSPFVLEAVSMRLPRCEMRFDYDGILNASQNFEMFSFSSVPIGTPDCLVIVRSFIRLSKNKVSNVRFRSCFLVFFFFSFLYL